MAKLDRLPARLELGGLALGKGRKNAADPLICLCNRVPLSVIQAAMDGGADTLAKLFDDTFAGCGPCGGSCQPELQKLLYEHQLSKLQPQEP